MGRCLNPTQSNDGIFQVERWKFCACLHYDAADDSDNYEDDYDIDYNIIDDYDADQNYSHCDFICI